MERVSDKVFDISLRLYACADADLHDANKIRILVAGVEKELSTARAEIERLKAEYDGMPTYNAVCQQMHDTEQELAAARAEIERLKAELAKLKGAT